MAGTKGNKCPKWAPKWLSAVLIVISTYHIRNYHFSGLLYFSMFSKSSSCLSSLNPGNKPCTGVDSFSITLPRAHHIVGSLSQHPDVIATHIINDKIYFISKDCCAG